MDKINKLTIVIPTRERCETLFHTIRCCLNQTYSNYELLICDNYSQDNTKEVVNSFNDKRIRYINSGERLSMSANFDFALKHVEKDSYLMYIGDDDGVLPNSLEYVNNIINKEQVEAVVSYNAFYTWPGTQKSNKLFWSPKEGYEIRDSKDWINKYLRFNMEYTFDLPGAYCGFVKRSVFDRVTKENLFFRSPTPDSYSALAIAFATDKYVYSNRPFAIHGSSTKSNGGAYLSKAKNDVGEEYKLFFKENSIPFHKDVVITKSFRIFSTEAFLQFSEIFPELTKDYKINWELLLRFILTERKPETSEEVETAVKQMCEMHNISYEKVVSSMPSKFTGVSFNEILNRLVVKIKNMIWKKTIRVDDTTKLGVWNVYDAAMLLNFFLNTKRN